MYEQESEMNRLMLSKSISHNEDLSFFHPVTELQPGLREDPFL